MPTYRQALRALRKAERQRDGHVFGNETCLRCWMPYVYGRCATYQRLAEAVQVAAERFAAALRQRKGGE